MANKNKKSGITAAVWILFTLIVVILFLVKQNDIKSVLKETDFFKYLFGENPEFVEKFELTKKDNDDTILLQNENDTQTEFTLSDDNKLVEKNGVKSEPINNTKVELNPVNINEDTAENADTVVVDKPSEEKKDKIVDSGDAELKPADPTKGDSNAAVVKKQNEYLCFIVIESNGSVTRKGITRQITKTMMPLTAALNDLLEGPLYDESTKGYISLIPVNTRLISASIKDGLATINFSSEFLYNKYGVDGFRGQLMQIVYTATSFSSINSVQIIINGEKTDFLGGEGIWIGSPFSRHDF